jgi:acyl-CoA dehydrogenase
MDFEHSTRVKELQARLTRFMDEHVYPNEARFFDEVEANKAKGDGWVPTRVMEEMKDQARAAGLWNLWLPESSLGPVSPTSNTRRSRRSLGARTSRPRRSTARRPTPATWKCWCATATPSRRSAGSKPLLAGEIRSGFAMTEPAVASSRCDQHRGTHRARRRHYVINGRKWWTSGAVLIPRPGHPSSWARTDPERAAIASSRCVLVPDGHHRAVRVIRHCGIMATSTSRNGHSEVAFENVRVRSPHILLGRGAASRSHRVAWARSHPPLPCVLIRQDPSACSRPCASGALGRRLSVATLSEQGVMARADRGCAHQDRPGAAHYAARGVEDGRGREQGRAEGNRDDQGRRANVACEVIDQAIQLFGGAGVTNDYGLAWAYAMARTLRIADGPTKCTAITSQSSKWRRTPRAEALACTCRQGGARHGRGPGIGRALCRELLRRGADGVVRRRSRWRAGDRRPRPNSWCLAGQCDVSSEPPCSAPCGRDRHYGRVDVVVSNAGFGRQELDLDDALSLPNEPGSACGTCTSWRTCTPRRAVLPACSSAAKAYLVNVASAAGMLCQVGDPRTARPSTRGGLAESPRDRVHGARRPCSVVCPQYVATAITGLDEDLRPESMPGCSR